MNYGWNFNVITTYWRALVHGALVTVELTLISCILASAFGLILAVGRMSRVKVLKWAAAAYVEAFLAIPLLVLIIWIYYCLPIFMRVANITAFSAALVAMTINLAPFVAETLRGGLLAIPRTLMEAGYCLGMSRSQVFRRIQFPIALRVVGPPLFTQYITMLKLSSLASVIAVPELLYTGGNIISTAYRPLEIYTTVALIYIILVLPLSIGARFLEKKYAISL